MTPLTSGVQSDPHIRGGAPVITCTRVPVRALIDYHTGGQPLSELLEDFPTVTRDQAVASLLLSAHSLVTDVRPA